MMHTLTTEILHCNDSRTTACCLCGVGWEQQFVAAGLLTGDDVLGFLCPRCLIRPPFETAAELRQQADHWQKEIGNTLSAFEPGSGSEPSADNELHAKIGRIRAEASRISAALRQSLARGMELQQRSRELVAQCHIATEVARRLVGESRLTRTGPTAGKAGAVVEELINDVEVLLKLADHIPRVDRWPTSISQLVTAERLCCLSRRPGLSKKAVKELVDDRYLRFLLKTA